MKQAVAKAVYDSVRINRGNIMQIEGVNSCEVKHLESDSDFEFHVRISEGNGDRYYKVRVSEESI